MIFISYFTSGVYEKVMSDYLMPSLKRWDLKYDIMKIPDLGSWQNNTGFKCEFIKDMLLTHEEDICFLDADATIESYPDLLFNIPEEYDIALHLLDWQMMWRNTPNQEQRELLSGTMIIKYRENMLKMMDKWITQVGIQKTIKEQKVLEKIVLNNPRYKLFDLPASYCAIKKKDGTTADYIGKPVILHHQVSRSYRKR